jgi:ABC-2 type transport system permease protein
MQDYTSGPGFLSTELYSMMIPLVLIAVGGTWGAAATAEEEDEGTADLLLTLPISRSRILISKMLAAISVVIVLAFLGLLNVIMLRGVVDMEIETGKLLAGTISSIAIGLFFTGVAFLIGAHSRSKGVAVGVVTGVALITFLIYSLSALVDDFDPIMPYNPMQWGLSGMPLFEGVDVVGSLKLVAGGLVAMIWAIMKFDRKDISTP